MWEKALLHGKGLNDGKVLGTELLAAGCVADCNCQSRFDDGLRESKSKKQKKGGGEDVERGIHIAAPEIESLPSIKMGSVKYMISTVLFFFPF